jgi:hypothetical protein
MGIYSIAAFSSIDGLNVSVSCVLVSCIVAVITFMIAIVHTNTRGTKNYLLVVLIYYTRFYTVPLRGKYFMQN